MLSKHNNNEKINFLFHDDGVVVDDINAVKLSFESKHPIVFVSLYSHVNKKIDFFISLKHILNTSIWQFENSCTITTNNNIFCIVWNEQSGYMLFGKVF